QALGDDRDAARGIDVGGNVLSAGFDIHENGGAGQDGLEIVDGEGHFGFARHGQQMQHGIGGARGAGDSGDGVFECFSGADVARAEIVAHGVHNDAAAAHADVFFALVKLRYGGGTHRGKANQLHDGGHGVGGELSAAGAGARAGVVFDI